MRPALVQRVHGGFHDIGRGVEIGLADFQVDDALALAFQGPRLGQNFKSSFGAQPRHAAGQLQFVLCGLCHDV